MLAMIGDLWRGSADRGRSAELSGAGPTTRPQTGARSAGGRGRHPAAWRTAAACVSALAVVSIASCSSSSGSGSSAGSGSAQAANVAAANAAIAPYKSQPTDFPVTDPLPQKLPAGTTFAYLQCSTPICAQVGKLLQGAVQAIGGKLTVVNAGATAQTAQAAASSAAPRTVVTDLQAHPNTNAAVFVSLSAATGLPAALKAAGLSVTTVGFGPTAGNLQDIKDGALTAALNIDFPVSTFTAVDAAARLIEGAQPTQGEQAGNVPEQFLEQKDITFDPTKGWSAFPDFGQRFAKLWHTAP